MPGFPTRRLRPRGAGLGAVIFSNPPIGVPEQLVWNLFLKFEPFWYADQTIEPCINADIWGMAVRDWRTLAGRTLTEATHDIEASFYIWQHDPATSSRILFGPRDDTHFPCRYEMTADFSGWEDDSDPALKLVAETTVEFYGVAIAAPLVAPDPANLAQACTIAARHIDLAAYAPPAFTGRFEFRPL